MMQTTSFSPGSVVTVKLSNGRELIATYHGQNDNHIMLSTIYRLDEKAESFFPYIKTLESTDQVLMCNVDQVFTVFFPTNDIKNNYLALKEKQKQRLAQKFAAKDNSEESEKGD